MVKILWSCLSIYHLLMMLNELALLIQQQHFWFHMTECIDWMEHCLPVLQSVVKPMLSYLLCANACSRNRCNTSSQCVFTNECRQPSAWKKKSTELISLISLSSNCQINIFCCCLLRDSVWAPNMNQPQICTSPLHHRCSQTSISSLRKWFISVSLL